jgi:hypothetical protein
MWGGGGAGGSSKFQYILLKVLTSCSELYNNVIVLWFKLICYVYVLYLNPVSKFRKFNVQNDDSLIQASTQKRKKVLVPHKLVKEVCNSKQITTLSSISKVIVKIDQYYFWIRQNDAVLWVRFMDLKDYNREL